MGVGLFRWQMQKRNDLWLAYVVSILLDGVRMCAEGVLIFYVETIVLFFFFFAFHLPNSPCSAEQQMACRQVWMRDWSRVACTKTQTHARYLHDLPGRTGPRGLRSVPSDPGDLGLCPVSPARVDWSLGRWGSVCPPLREIRECTVVFIVWLPGLGKRVMISNDISSAHHTHHLFIRGRKVNGW